jgi:hypothetical protein
MTSKERLLTAVRGEIPDRVPVSTYELNAHNKDQFENHEPSYKRLMAAIGELGDEMLMTGTGSLPNAAENIETQTWTDAAGSRFRRQIWPTPKGDLTRLLRDDPNIHTTWQIEHWCKTSKDLERVLSVPFEPTSVDRSFLLRQQKDLGEKGVLLISIVDPLCPAAELFSMADYTVFAFSEPEKFRYLLDVLFERIKVELRQTLATGIRDCVFRVVGAEYAAPPYMPPALFEKYVVPYDTWMNRTIGESGNYPRMHCHGKIGKVLDLIAATKPAGLDPCEPPNQGDIELDAIKRRIGDRVCLMGNVELRDLEGSTPPQVRQIVKHCMDQAKPGGRYVLMPTAAPINVPLAPQTEANYLAYLEAAHEYGRY